MRSLPVRLIILFAVLAAALPLVLARPAPFTDWPNHLARVHILTELLRGDPFWSQFYSLNPALVPNAALDLGIGALNLVGVDLDWAASLFLVFAYAVFVGGFCRLAWAFGALDRSKPLLGSILFFTGPLMFGLVNYMLGLGVAFWLLAAWLRGSPRTRYALAVLGTPVLFYVHLLAAGVWVLVALCMEAPAMLAGLRRPTLLPRSMSAVTAGFVFLALLVASEAGTGSMPNGDGTNFWYPGHGVFWPTLDWKASILLRMVTDHAMELASAVTLVGLAVFILAAVTAGRARLGMGVWLAIAALASVVAALPEAAGRGSLLDYRLALAPFLIGAAALRVAWRSGWGRHLALAALVAVSLGRTGGFAWDFVRQQVVIRALEHATATLPPGSVLLTAFGHGRDDIANQLWWGPPTEHLAARAVAHGVFVPTVFADGSQQPVVLRHQFDAWRRTWEVRTRPELAAMAEDVRPLCATAAEQGRRVALFVAYPGAFLDSMVEPSAVIATDPAFRLLDICAMPAFAS